MRKEAKEQREEGDDECVKVNGVGEMEVQRGQQKKEKSGGAGDDKKSSKWREYLAVDEKREG